MKRDTVTLIGQYANEIHKEINEINFIANMALLNTTILDDNRDYSKLYEKIAKIKDSSEKLRSHVRDCWTEEERIKPLGMKLE